ncbi:hypothetical protein, partial [Mesorhizobium sp. B3-1-9]|uniref:hypothetical protein n=1 Tax=Mesorhizobium sp. B3-1-9 TaxID=2589892 RepID=UPI0015E2E55A
VGKGKTLPQIIVSDPDWFFWAIDQGAFKGGLAIQAQKLAQRARKIKLPPALVNDHCKQYLLTPDGKFAGFKVIHQDQPAHVGSSSEVRKPTLNLEAPRHFAQYDKLGCKLLLKTFKYYWFSDKPFSKKRVEDFFDDPARFLNP